MGLPSEGVFDALAARIGEFGLLLHAGGTAGKLSPETDFLPHRTWSQLADGYIAFAPLRDLRGCTIDADFVREANWDRVLREWPDIDWTPRPTSIDGMYAERTEAFAYPEAWGIARD